MYFCAIMGPSNYVQVTRLSSAQTDDAVTVLCDAFQDYPVMRYVLGPTGDYDRRLRTLVGFCVSARVYRDEPGENQQWEDELPPSACRHDTISWVRGAPTLDPACRSPVTRWSRIGIVPRGQFYGSHRVTCHRILPSAVPTLKPTPTVRGGYQEENL
jgi:hypothetical protein